MARVSSLIIILLLALTAACTQQAQSLPDNQENRTTLAKKYLEVMPPKELLAGVESRVTPNLPEEKRQVFKEAINSEEVQKFAYNTMLNGLVKNFTTAELNAMIAFYSSPAGQSAWKKFSPYMNEVMPPIQQEVRKVVEAKMPPAAKEATKPQPQAAPPAPKEKKEPTKPDK